MKNGNHRAGAFEKERKKFTIKILISNHKPESSRLDLDLIKPELYNFRLTETVAQPLLKEFSTVLKG